MKTLIIAILLSICVTTVSAQEMKPHMPKLKLNGNSVLYEKSISSNKVSIFYRKLEQGEVLGPTFYRIPNTDNNYFVTAVIRGKTQYSYPRMGFLFEQSKGAIIEKFRSPSFGERVQLKPIFFIGKESVLILAEKEYAGFHGIEAFEFKDKQLVYLGSLVLAYKSCFNTGELKGFCGYENPLKLHYGPNPAEKVKIFAQNNFYQIELKGEFYENFETSAERKISSINSTVIYKLNKSGFQLLKVKSNKQ